MTPRTLTTNIKIPREATGLMGALVLHIEQEPDGTLAGVSLSHPGKFDSTRLSEIIAAVNEAMAEALAGAEAEAVRG